jgi:hypothetical protein
MKVTHLSRLTVLSLAFGFMAPLAFGQSVLGKTDLGKSQNTSEDLMNSLIVNKQPKVGKGEKKEEVDPKKLQSKTTNDKTFSGSLNDIGLDWGGDKMGKPHAGSAGEAESKNAKQSEATGEKSASKTADASNDKKSTAATNVDPAKQQTSTSSTASNEKSPDKH